MPTFAYSAVDGSGKTVKGQIDAENEQLVLAKLHEQHYHVTSVTERRSSRAAVASTRGTSSKKVKLAAMVVFSRQFATMIDAGVAIVRCLDILEGQTKDPALRPVIGQCKKDVKGGLSLTDAFAKHPNVFSRLYVNMVKAAETGGILDKILDRLATFLENEQEVRGKIKSAMIYPILVLSFAVIMVVGLMLFVMPKFKDIFIQMNVEMPPTTQILFDISGLMQQYWYIMAALSIGGYFGFKYWSKTEAGGWQVDMIKLKAPVVGELVQKMAVSRFARTFATLIASGVPMMRSLEIVSETAGNKVIAKVIEGARSAVREGQKITTPLEQSKMFPGMVTHMIDIGEETGRLSEMLAKVADFYDSEVDMAVKTLTSLIEPLLIVMMGGLVGFIAVSIMGPIFKLVSSIS